MTDETKTFDPSELQFDLQVQIIDTLLSTDWVKGLMETFNIDDDKQAAVERLVEFLHTATFNGFRASHPLGLILAMIDEMGRRYPDGQFLCDPKFSDDDSTVSCEVKFGVDTYAFRDEPTVRLQNLLIRFMRAEAEKDAAIQAEVAASMQTGVQDVVEGEVVGVPVRSPDDHEVLDVMTGDVEVSDSLDVLNGPVDVTEELQ